MSKSSKLEMLLLLGDTSLVAGHRLSEWCGHAPTLEEDIALSNIALDLLGQAQSALSLAAGDDSTADRLAYFRDAKDFHSLSIASLPNGDFAKTTLKQFFISLFLFKTYQSLQNSTDSELKELADKALTELQYHLRHTARWLVTLAGGTKESEERLLQAIEEVSPFLAELFDGSDSENKYLKSISAQTRAELKQSLMNSVEEVFKNTGINIDKFVTAQTTANTSSDQHLSDLLAEMQQLARAHPDAKW